MIKYAKLIPALDNNGYKINLDYMLPNIKEGSYNVLFARIFGLSYPDFLRCVRDVFGAEIRGKNCRYPYFIFKTASPEANNFVNIVNERLNKIER